MLFRFILFVASFVFGFDSAYGLSVELVASRDNTLYETSSAVSNGQGSHLFSGLTAAVGTAAPFLRRTLMYFDVSGLPANAQVEMVSVRLYLNKVPNVGPSSADFSLHRAMVDWGEGGSSASGQEGTGAAAQEGDATWTDAFYSATTPMAWTQAGGDFVSVSSATMSTAGVDSLYFFNSTLSLVSDVQGWIDAPAGNFGWFLNGEEGVLGSARRFASSADEDLGPTLFVEYSVVPEPSTGLLFVVGLGLLMRSRLFRRV